MTHATIAYLARRTLQARALFPAPSPITLGGITLLPHQAAAVQWLQRRIDRYGGALLADPPGMGKTYVALAIAARRNTRPCVIAPAALRGRWQEAASITGVPIDFVSVERLSAPPTVRAGTPDFVIIDEAHHLRTTTTRRHRRTARLCECAQVLLLTATPIHNRPDDLECITTLFHLPPTRQTSAALRRLTLRRTVEQIHAAGMSDGTALHIPAVQHRRPLRPLTRAGTITRAIASLPRIDTTDREGHPLLQLGLLHALRSSDAACATRVRHRIAATLAFEQAARAHVTPTPALRKAWTAGADAIQLAMPQLLSTQATTIDPAVADRAARQRTALEQMLPLLDGHGDARRAAALRRFARWCRHPVVAFTQFTTTAESLFRRLSAVPGIALLCGAEARIASGVIPRGEVLARLMSPDRRPHTAVRLLITTDVLSEGLSLTGVATVVHLDLPWTAARLDQRVGRAARIAAPVPAVRVMEMLASTPAGTETRLRKLLHRKRGDMTEFEHRQRDEIPRLALLKQLAAGTRDDATQPRPGWVTVRSTRMGGSTLRVIALVRMLGRRQMIAHDEGWLRSVSHADAQALTHAVAWRKGAGKRVRTALLALLQEHVDDEELLAFISRPADERLEARRAVDTRLLDGGLQQRLALAPHVAATRRDLMQLTGRSQLSGIAEYLKGLETKLELAERGARVVDPGDGRITVYTGIVILPA
jgi:superfamily II DNA or RNA helicase